MFKVVLNDLLINIKKNWIQILLSFIMYFLVIIYTSSMGIYLINSKSVEQSNSIFLDEKSVAMLITLISCSSIIFLYDIMSRIPLRLSKAMFVCAAGEKEKIRYILLQLCVKIVFSFIVIFTLTYILAGSIFISKNLIVNIIQMILYFFIILNINLKIGIGERGAKKKDKNDYVIITKEEEIVNIYWFCLLILETVIFYSLVNLNVKINILGIIAWAIAIALNIFIVYKNAYPILKKSLSYEDVYCQVAERNDYY